jgi:hypothetical protein
MMKNIIEKFQICLVLSALLFSSFVAACSGNDDTVTPEITIPANILTDGMTFSKTGGTSTLNIKSNVALEVTSSAPEWCKVTAESHAIFSGKRKCQVKSGLLRRKIAANLRESPCFSPLPPFCLSGSVQRFMNGPLR